VKQAIGKPPKQLIDETREQRLKLLLETTGSQIKEIAFEMGFGSVEELCRFFQTDNQHFTRKIPLKTKKRAVPHAQAWQNCQFNVQNGF
jgi:transcriptional regulator GlxA family with amidase domain